MNLPNRTIHCSRPEAGCTLNDLIEREWLVANGLGGYASGSISGVPTRRFHGLLVAALPPPIGRALMLSEVAEKVQLPDGTILLLGGYEREGHPTQLDTAKTLQSMRLEGGLPIWTYRFAGFVLEKRIHLVHSQNTVVAQWRLVDAPEGAQLKIWLRTFVTFRPHEGPVKGPNASDYRVTGHGGEHEVHGPAPYPPLRLKTNCEFIEDTFTVSDVMYRVERARGYDWLGSTWSPGHFETKLAKGHEVSLVASTEDWDAIRALPTPAAASAERVRRMRLLQHAGAKLPLSEELVLAADAFLIRPSSRFGDGVGAKAQGDELRSVIAGYHWFTDWGRDTMISLEGLTLATGRFTEAGYILRTFARYVRDGLIPNMFPEGKSAGLYHTADATLWFFHALDRYISITGDRLTLRQLLPTMRGIVEAHLRGTHFGIHVDPKDGLLSQGQDGYQLTWMDAKVDGWVVTPRRGKAVEINALWFNALAVLARWLDEEKEDSRAIRDAASRARESFNLRFWNNERGYLFDVIDGPEPELGPALRPNQIFAVSLPNPVLDPSRWSTVVGVVERELLTPVGLRSLGRNEPDYKRSYDGDLRARDAAYHQGTVWSWLIGPFVDAWLRVHPENPADALRFLAGFQPHLDAGCIGQVSEIFDAEPPFHHRGCVAQAWGVAELLRIYRKLTG
jgi:predicted glycogen debranching enzyme